MKKWRGRTAGRRWAAASGSALSSPAGRGDADPRAGRGSELYFPNGLLGFDNLKKFAISDVIDCQPFMAMNSVSDSGVRFILVDPGRLLPDAYEVVLSEEDEETLDLQPGDPLSIFVLVSPGEAEGKATANLRGPLVVNDRNGVGKQLVIYNPDYSFRHPIAPSRRGNKEKRTDCRAQRASAC